MHASGWALKTPGEPLVPFELDLEPGPGEVVVEVKGCGVCHTDVAFLYEGVPVRGGAPRILGHEVAGIVVACGIGAGSWAGASVVVPAVIPCGECDACRRGKTGICPAQTFLGNDIHGGFSSHVRVPARGLCRIPSTLQEPGVLRKLAVVADAVTTALHAVVASELRSGDLAIFVGVGGVGSFGAQIARSMEATTIALDVDLERLALSGAHGADHTIPVRDRSPDEIRKELRSLVKQRGLPGSEWKIFETSGTPSGQKLAYHLLGFGATLMVVGFSSQTVELKLSNLMAYEARALGVWGCPPDLYGRALELVGDGSVQLDPFVEIRPMSQVNQVLKDVHYGLARKRIVLTPD